MVSMKPQSRLLEILTELTKKKCTASDVYTGCAIGSLQSQAMAKALIEIIFEFSDEIGRDREIEDRLEQALEKALRASPWDV